MESKTNHRKEKVRRNRAVTRPLAVIIKRVNKSGENGMMVNCNYGKGFTYKTNIDDFAFEITCDCDKRVST